MSLADVLIIALVAACVVLALRHVRKKGGGCTGNCAECRSRGSAHCDKKK